jgi:hypothetical protein
MNCQHCGTPLPPNVVETESIAAEAVPRLTTVV